MTENTRAGSGYDQLVEKVGGRFKASVAIQKRVRELVRGANPLIPVSPEMNPIEIALKEILDDKVKLVDKLVTGKMMVVKEVSTKKVVDKSAKKKK